MLFVDMYLEIVIGIISVVLLLYYIFNTKENLKNLPPGPKGRVFFGIDVDIPYIHLNFTNWAEKYGDIFEVKIFGRRMVVLNSPEKIRKAFESEEYKLQLNHRPPNFIGYKICNQYKCVLLRRYDNLFKDMKKEMIDSLDTHGFQSAHFRSVAADILTGVINDFTDLRGRPCDPMKVLRPTFCQMISCMFSGELSPKLQKHVDEFDCQGNVMIRPQVHAVYNKFPWIRWIPFQFYQHLYSSIKGLRHKLKQSLLFEMRNTYDRNNIKSMVHHLFRSQECGKSWLTDDHIQGIAMDLINTSILTTKSVMSGFIFLLLHFPEIQQKIQAEIDTVIGQERAPDVDDRKNMPYLQACIFECLRYQSHLPLTAAHYNTKKVDIFGYTIPPNTIIFGNLFACHHDDRLWTDPYMYIPERFLTDEGKLVASSHPNRRNLISFGVGERVCVGYKMALNRMFLYTAYILQKFTFVVSNGTTLKSHDPRQMISESPVILPPPYMCRVVKRKDLN